MPSMKTASSKYERFEAAEGSQRQRRWTITRTHAMYVVPVKAILDPGFTIRTHEEVKAAGQLVVYEDGMEGKVLFCSHTWLRNSHPDNSQGVKLQLLRAILKRALEGKYDIEPHWGVQVVYKNKKDTQAMWLRGADMRRDLENGYVFFECAPLPI